MGPGPNGPALNACAPACGADAAEPAGVSWDEGSLLASAAA
jgi:hypothetical protein